MADRKPDALTRRRDGVAPTPRRARTPTARPRNASGRLRGYVELMRLDRPIGIYLLLWPTLWALWVAGEGHPDGGVFLIFVIGVVVTRSAGCVINDVADRNLDKNIRRTRSRPLAERRVTVTEAIVLFIGLAVIAIGLASMLNSLARWLAVAAAALMCLYPFTKRIFSVPQLVLGAAFGWAVPMAFAAQTGELTETTWLVFAIAVVWAVIYDTLYAMVDREDDLQVGIRSSAILFGEADRFVIATLQILMLLGLGLLGARASLGLWFYASILIASVFMAYEQWLIRDAEPAACFQAFLNNHYVGMTIFAGIALDYVFSG